MVWGKTRETDYLSVLDAVFSLPFGHYKIPDQPDRKTALFYAYFHGLDDRMAALGKNGEGCSISNREALAFLPFSQKIEKPQPVDRLIILVR